MNDALIFQGRIIIREDPLAVKPSAEGDVKQWVCDINGCQVALGFPKVVKMTGLNQKSVSIRYYKIMCNKEVFPVNRIVPEA